MRDLTQGSIRTHLLEMSAFLALGMLVQTLYYLVDLYFVARLGQSAVAGVSAAGTLNFVVMALTQGLGVSTVSLISHAVGRKDEADARHLFHQAVLLSLLCAVGTLLAGYAGLRGFMRSMSDDPATVEHGVIYLRWYLPGLALQFAITAMASALRATGIVRPSMLVQVFTLGLNILLAPVLIAGWGGGVALGVRGAALATTISVTAGALLLCAYFVTTERGPGRTRDEASLRARYIAFDARALRPSLPTFQRMLNVGVPAGGELMHTFVLMWVIYRCLQDFGPAAQAGYGVGSRVLQAMFLPMMAVAFAAAPIAGQNFGARNAARVRETFRSASIAISVMMATLTLVCQWRPELLVKLMATDPAVVEVGAGYLRITSLNFVALGIVFTCSGLFQAMGNTWPAMASGMGRLALFCVPALWLSGRTGTRLEELWYIAVASIVLQAGASLWLLRVEFRRRLRFAPSPGLGAVSATQSAVVRSG